MVEKDNKEEIQVNIEPDIITKECRVCKGIFPITNFRVGCIRCKPCEYQSKKCIHGIQKIYCYECGFVKLCEHGTNKITCKVCCKRYNCIHNISKSLCKECGGKSLCIHDKPKRNCKECKGSSYCQHGKQKKICKLEGCNPTALCTHGIQKARCRPCGGSLICQHNKERYYCVDCSPNRACQMCFGVLVKKKSRCYPLCQACFSFANPGSELVTAYKVKERYLTDELRARLKDIPVQLTFDKIVEGGCSKRRPDVLIDCLTHSIVIECDENQHKNYECENKRTMEIFQDLGNRPLVFIRFNPDSYFRKDSTRQPSCFTPLTDIEDIHKKKFYNLVEDEWIRRINILEPIIKQYLDLNTFPQKEITIVTLFYDNFD